MSNSSGLSGLTFAFAGRFSKKQVVEKLIKSNGGTTSSTVSGKVTHLVISENSSTNTEASEKYIKAKKNNIPIIKESEFFDLCRQKGINVNEGSSAPSSSTTQEPKQSPYFSSTTTTPQTPEKESSKSPKSDQKTSTTTTNSLNSLNSNNDDFNVVIIGKTATPREDLKSLVETSGGTLIDSICPEANFLVCSEKEHPDLLKAVEYNIKIINEGQLIRVCDYQANLRMTNKKSAHKTSPTKPKETKPENTNNTENPKNDDSNESSKTDNSNDASNLNENHISSNVEITNNQDSEISSNGKERSPKSEEGRLTKRAKVLLEGDVGSEWQCTFYGNDSNTSNENNTSNEVV